MLSHQRVIQTCGYQPVNYYLGGAEVDPAFQHINNRYQIAITFSADTPFAFTETFVNFNPTIVIYKESDGRHGAWFGYLALNAEEYFAWIIQHGDILKWRLQ